MLPVFVFPGAGGAPVSGVGPSFGGAIVLTNDGPGTRITDSILDENAAVGGVGGDLAILAAPSTRLVGHLLLHEIHHRAFNVHKAPYLLP